ncbi:hypothetical protein Tco_0770601 [Tanacetum coccineum]|uniref:Uncharacterized protein n=1 Tax=Tanacetum coccineum TaxID=301880 RepID=A0ABQ4ZDR0_9ASTR
MLSSTRVKPSTSTSGSQPSGNTKKDKILQTQSSTQMNKVEAHPRKVKVSLKNKDHVVAPKGTAHVQHSKDHLCSAMCAMGKSKKKPHKPKSEDTNQEKLYIMHMDLCGPVRVARRIIETIHVDFDELTAMASEHSSSGLALYEMTPATISLGLVPNPPPSTPYHPASEVVAPIDEVAAPVPVVSIGLPSSTTVDQDAPSPSNSQTTPDTQPPVIPNDVERCNHDIASCTYG